MPAGFNKGQVEYIKAIASVNDHKTYKPISYPATQSLTISNDLTKTHNTALSYRLWCLGKRPIVRDTLGNLTQLGSATIDSLDAFDIPMDVGSSADPFVTERHGSEGFLESTHLRLRCVLPNEDATGDMSVLHGEYRIIVFRARERQHHEKEHTMDQSNPFYNLFRGARNHNIGFNGYEHKEGEVGNVAYEDNSNAAFYDQYWVSHDGAMTLPINRESYVVMKDHRFFLGKEYGGKNIYETTLHWDWNDPLDTASSDVTDGIQDKNFTWYILIMGTTNNFDGAAAPKLTVKITGTTHMTSG